MKEALVNPQRCRRLLALAVLQANCSNVPAAPEVQFSEENGVTVATSGPLPDLYASDFQWTLTRVRAIPANRGPSDPPRFFKPEAAFRLADGRIVVNDQGDQRVVVLGSEGDSVLATFGRPGQGPGEFGVSVHLWPAPGEAIWVLDSRNQKVMRFALDGNLLSERGLARGVGGMAYAKVRRNPPGLVVCRWYPSSDPNRALQDSLTEFDPEIGKFHSAIPFWRKAGPSTLDLMGQRALFTPVNRGVVVGRSHDNTLQVYSGEGRVVAEIRLPLSTRPIPETDVRAIVEDFAGALGPGMQSRYPEPDVHTEYPITNELYSVDDSTFAMLQGHRMSAAEDPPVPAGRWIWRLFTIGGTYRGTIHWPEGFRILWVGDNRALGVASDSTGAEYLEEWELKPPDGVWKRSSR